MSDKDPDYPKSDHIEDGSLVKHDAAPFSFQDLVQNNFYISGGWDLWYYFTTRGAENFHIYLWIAKDLAWTQNCYYPAMIFGIAALVWCGVLLFHMVDDRNAEEIYMWVPTFLWLSANFLWMAGEVFHGDDDYVVPKTAAIMEAAISWILLYHVILKPFKILKTGQYGEDSSYHRPGLTPRIPYFEFWRQYEHAHTLCWLGKDLSWNRKDPVFWIICLVPTILIAADFIIVTFLSRRMMEDTIHYIAQLLWVIGNMLWALGNIFIDDDDEAHNFMYMDRKARAHMRTWASWLLFVALWPIIILYAVWLPLTFMNKFNSTAAEKFEVHSRNKHNDKAQEATTSTPSPVHSPAGPSASLERDMY